MKAVPLWTMTALGAAGLPMTIIGIYWQFGGVRRAGLVVAANCPMDGPRRDATG